MGIPRRAAVLLAAWIVVACGGGEGGGEASDRCSPGESRACTCVNGSSSTKRCSSSGNGWLSCDCTPDAVSPSDVPGADVLASDADAATAPDGCAPQCDQRECGADGCGGTCGACASGSACTPTGRCEGVACGGAPTTVIGALQTHLVPLEFDGVTVGVTHKRDIDTVEDGCLVEIRLDFKRGDGCHLQIVANQQVDSAGALRIHEVHFSADSQCPGFLDEWEGTYALADAPTTGYVSPGILKVPDYNVASSCFHSTLSVALQGRLVRQEPAPALELTLAGCSLEIEGDFTSTGSMETSCPCRWSCSGKACGDDGCGGSCGSCACGETCVGGTCDFTACDTKSCGSDGCGGSCGACTLWPGSFCKPAGACGCQPQCGGKACGDDGCGGSCGACGCGQTCTSGQCVIGTCLDQECGSDGCGGTCGTCGCGESCLDGKCLDVACAARECGDDGCGGSCGSCTACGETCEDGQCVFSACQGKQCGWDGCGGDCGACPMCGTSCNPGGQCEWTACANKECGPDGCGGSCGVCTQFPSSACKADGFCGCEPQCSGKQCGDNGCGGTCGSCTGKDEECQDGQCVYEGGLFPHYDQGGCDHCACEQCVCKSRPECCSSMWDYTCVDLCKTSCGGGGACEPSCPADATYCGMDGCNTVCATCAAGKPCFDDHCCTPTCASGTCGDDGCGGSCAYNCGAGEYCADWSGGDKKCYTGAAGDPCDASGRCWDDKECTYDACVGGVCTLDASLCCVTNGPCDNGDDLCTTDTCVSGECHYAPKGAAGCCATTLLAVDFEGPLPDTFEIDAPTWNNVSWHVFEGSKFSTANHALYFGNPDKWTCDGTNGTFAARFGGLALPAGVALRLEFDLWIDLSAWDDFVVRVVADNGVSAVFLSGNSYQGGLTPETWLAKGYDLSGFAGHSVTLEFSGSRNTWDYFWMEGVWLDDIVVTSTCKPQPCATQWDCKAWSPATCVAGGCVYAM